MFFGGGGGSFDWAGCVDSDWVEVAASIGWNEGAVFGAEGECFEGYFCAKGCGMKLFVYICTCQFRRHV